MVLCLQKFHRILLHRRISTNKPYQNTIVLASRCVLFSSSETPFNPYDSDNIRNSREKEANGNQWAMQNNNANPSRDTEKTPSRKMRKKIWHSFEVSFGCVHVCQKRQAAPIRLNPLLFSVSLCACHLTVWFGHFDQQSNEMVTSMPSHFYEIVWKYLAGSKCDWAHHFRIMRMNKIEYSTQCRVHFSSIFAFEM